MAQVADVGVTHPAAAPVRRLRGWRLAAFAAPALPVGALNTPLAVYLPAHYSGYVGLSLGAVGLAFFIVRTLDIGFDPLVGMLVDRTRTRWGQCRPWFVAGAAALSLASLTLFLAEPGASLGRLIGGLLLVYAGVSIAGVVHPAWASRLSNNYNDRSRIYAWMYFAASVGTFLLLGGPALLGMAVALPAGGEVRVMGWALAIAAPVGVAIALATTREPPPAQARAGVEDRVRLSDYLVLLKRPAMRRLFAADVFISLATGASIGLFVFFWRARGLGMPVINAMILAYLAAAIASVPAWTWVARRIGKHRALIASAAAYVVVLPTMAILPPDRLDLIFPALGFMGLTFAASTFLIRAMAADAADEARLHSGLDRTGQVYALLAATQKLGAAVALGLAFAILERLKFDPADAAASSPAALNALTMLYVGAPAALMVLGALCLVGYGLDSAAHARIRQELATRDTG